LSQCEVDGGTPAGRGDVEISEEMHNCPCGQEIKEHCYIENSITGHRTHVGNICINRFMGINTGTLFDGLKRIAADPYANPNEALVEFAWKQGHLYDEREYEFVQQMCRKRKRSDAQKSWIAKINRRILNKIVVKKRSRIEQLSYRSTWRFIELSAIPNSTFSS